MLIKRTERYQLQQLTISQQCFKKIANGANPIELKRGIDKAVEKVIDKLIPEINALRFMHGGEFKFKDVDMDCYAYI